MKTDTMLLTERLEAARNRQGELKQSLAKVQRELAEEEANIERYLMALDVLSTLGGKTGKAAKAAMDLLPASSSASGEKRSLADMIVERVTAEPGGLTTGEVFAAVQKLSKDAQYGSVVAVISRLVNKSAALRREGKRLFLAK